MSQQTTNRPIARNSQRRGRGGLAAGLAVVCLAASVAAAVLAFRRPIRLSVGPIECVEHGDKWIVNCRRSFGIVEYEVNKESRLSQDNLFVQFIPMIKLNGIPVSHTPYFGGLSGMVLRAKSSECDNWLAERPKISQSGLEILYRNREDERRVRFVFLRNLPLLRIEAFGCALDTQRDHAKPLVRFFNWIFWQAIGGAYNPSNRVVVPQGEDAYFVINGQAEGVHYFPSSETWSLRMGAEGTHCEDITVGFVAKDEKDVRRLNSSNPRPPTWGEWAMGQDLYADTNNQFKSSFDVVPYGLENITNDIFYDYQEDEAGLGYSWTDISSSLFSVKSGEEYRHEIYLWVGVDHWRGEYGRNNESNYRFMIDRYQDDM